jgi:hypothetical protein
MKRQNERREEFLCTFVDLLYFYCFRGKVHPGRLSGPHTLYKMGNKDSFPQEKGAEAWDSPRLYGVQRDKFTSLSFVLRIKPTL